MTKSQFLDILRSELSFLSRDELESQLGFYGEMIDDRIEEGLSEEDAIRAIGDIDKIVSQLKADDENRTEESEKPKEKRRLGAWAIILIVLGSPIWISLGAAAFAIIVAIYAVIWAISGSLWALPASLAAIFLAGAAAGVVTIVYGNALLGITLVGASIACAGLSIFAAFGCFYLTQGAVFLSKTIARFIISLFVRKENKNA